MKLLAPDLVRAPEGCAWEVTRSRLRLSELLLRDGIRYWRVPRADSSRIPAARGVTRDLTAHSGRESCATCAQ